MISNCSQSFVVCVNTLLRVLVLPGKIVGCGAGDKQRTEPHFQMKSHWGLKVKFCVKFSYKGHF